MKKALIMALILMMALTVGVGYAAAELVFHVLHVVVQSEVVSGFLRVRDEGNHAIPSQLLVYAESNGFHSCVMFLDFVAKILKITESMAFGD